MKSSLIESEERLRKAQAMAHVGSWEIDLRANTILISQEAFRVYRFAYTHGPRGQVFSFDPLNTEVKIQDLTPSLF